MTRITTIANQKGGVGKTTTAWALASGLALKGNRVLVIDADPQGNLSFTMGADDQKAGVYEVLKGDVAPTDAIQHTEQGDIIASSLLLAAADIEFTDTGREYLLREATEPLKKEYDYIIIDTPPTLGIITINALGASNDVIIPMGADIYSLQGLSQLYITINKVKRYCNPPLRIAGLLITRFNGRSVLGRDLKEVITEKAQQLNANAFDTVIREGVAIRETQTQQAGLFMASPKCNPAQDYAMFVNEYLRGYL